jgi:hypothetical protein
VSTTSSVAAATSSWGADEVVDASYSLTRKRLLCRDCTNQILKAALAINSGVLAEMEIPSAYLETLPKV